MTLKWKNIQFYIEHFNVHEIHHHYRNIIFIHIAASNKFHNFIFSQKKNQFITNGSMMIQMNGVKRFIHFSQ